jgi:hypothetical protein
MLHLTIGLWMRDGCPVHADLVFVQKLLEFPLSVMIEFGTPNRWMMSVKKDTACSARRFVIGHASIHLENLSTSTSKWV